MLRHHLRKPVWAVCQGAILVLSVSGLCSGVSASILPVGAEPSWWSDISVQLTGSYTYNSSLGRGTLTANGMSRATSFDSGIHNSVYNLLLNGFAPVSITGLIVEADGDVFSNGTLKITLPNSIGPYAAGLLLEATIDDVEFIPSTPANKYLQLGFIVTNGSAKNDFGGVGGMGAVKIVLPTAAPNAFAGNFTIGTGLGTPADIIGPPVPEPTSFWVFAGLALAASIPFRAFRS